MIRTFEPTQVWRYFEEISAIPRASKKEDKIRAYLVDFAKSNKLECECDEAGNVLIKKGATCSYEQKSTIALQTHMDMVCEKDSMLVHDFDNDPIELQVSKGWIKAKGTTLGADNGVGMAMQLAILASNDIQHPALECLFTVDEETGLYGATHLKSDWLKAASLINLDTEDEGEFCVGCAGGMDTLAEIPLVREELPARYFYFEVKVGGLQGGHSGGDINKKRANAIKLLVSYLDILNKKTTVYIGDIKGGNLRNAIPREAMAIVAVPFAEKEMVRVEINHFIADMEREFSDEEKTMFVELNSTDSLPRVLTKQLSADLIGALNDCPHGVIEMNEEIPSLVETSTNLAALQIKEDNILIETSQRSADEGKKQAIAERVGEVFREIGGDIKKGKDYPGWKMDVKSPLLQRMKSIYTTMFGVEPKIEIVHAGLECGVIAQKYPEMEMISIGPTIVNPHSPSESVNIASVDKCWKFLISTLAD